MMINKHYTLTSRTGIYTAVGSCATVIGQSEGCDLRLANSTQYADVIFAKIIPNEAGDGWHLVKLTPYYSVAINGVDVNRVHYLEDGDVIDFNGDVYRFNVKPGENAVSTVVHIHHNRRMLALLVGIMAAFALVVGYRFYSDERENLTDSMRMEVEASLFSTRVDSIHLMRGDSLVESYAYASSPVGTAFLTRDSLLVTARHCIQPWLNQVLPPDYGRIPEMTDWAVAKALFAETENQMCGEELWRLVSFVTLTDASGNMSSMSSDRFAINTECDEIVELGDYDNPQYWRSITHRYLRRDMMLGDVAVAKADSAGNISIADAGKLTQLLGGNTGQKLTFFGHPESGVNGCRMESVSDNLRLPLDSTTVVPGRIFLLAHNGALTPGYSGGPVVVRDGIDGFCAVGIVSVVDDKNGNRSYSVPTSEVFYIIDK